MVSSLIPSLPPNDVFARCLRSQASWSLIQILTTIYVACFREKANRSTNFAIKAGFDSKAVVKIYILIKITISHKGVYLLRQIFSNVKLAIYRQKTILLVCSGSVGIQRCAITFYPGPYLCIYSRTNSHRLPILGWLCDRQWQSSIKEGTVY